MCTVLHASGHSDRSGHVFGVRVGVGVAVGVRVAARVGVGVAVGVRVGVRVGVGVAVGVRVAARVGVGVTVGVRVAARVGVGITVGVRVGITVGGTVKVGVTVGVGTRVIVGCGARDWACAGCEVTKPTTKAKRRKNPLAQHASIFPVHEPVHACSLENSARLPIFMVTLMHLRM